MVAREPAACHHFITEDATSAKMAEKLGYHFTGGFPDGVDDPIKQPMDLMKDALSGPRHYEEIPALTLIAECSVDRLDAMRSSVRADYEAFCARGLKLDMTRGKPAPEQLALAAAMLTLPGNGDTTSEAGEDARNYGNLQGLAEARALYAPILGTSPAQVVAADQLVARPNATIACCGPWSKGVPGGARSNLERPWSKPSKHGEQGPAFLCPVPGYDRPLPRSATPIASA